MLYAFIDESYSKDRFYIGAFVVQEDDLKKVAEAVQRVGRYAEGFGVEPGAELHAHAIMSGKGDWKAVRGKHRAAIAVYRKAMHELAALDAKLIIEGVDVNRLNSRYRYPRAPHSIALQHVLEGVNILARNKNERALIIADEVQDQAEHGARAERYQLDGTPGYRSSNLAYLDLPITFGPSHKSPGLQAADLCVYLYRRLDSEDAQDSRATAAAVDLWSITHPIRWKIRRWDP